MIDTTLKDLLNFSLEFRYQMLDRMRQDCDFYLSVSKNKEYLWAYDEAKHIRYMKVLWNSLDEKPEWLSYEDILEYEKGFKEALEEPSHRSAIQRPYEFLAENNNVYIETPYYTPIDEMDWGDGESMEMEIRPLYFDTCDGTYLVIDEWWDKLNPYEYPNKYDGVDLHFCIGRSVYGVISKKPYSVIVNSPILPHKEFGYDHEPKRIEAYNDFTLDLYNIKQKDSEKTDDLKQEQNNGRER